MLKWKDTTPMALQSPLREILEYLCKALVDYPEALLIEEANTGNAVVFSISSTEKGDVAKLIGKQGKNIDAVRQIMRCASFKHKKELYLKVNDPHS